ncbi:hypothetical protein [Aquisphaera insulae]|uniref:hypothetical protein n=1 Tax=Aquisphaera insulae TaxID=2712864 RepID=UPI002030A071|nr:hypothetical protein [Aquisphaera insulae]
MIIGIGLVSLATLFPLGLLRLREAQRQSRSAYLTESAAADIAARGLFRADTFAAADFLNSYPPAPWAAGSFNRWFYSPVKASLDPAGDGSFNPLLQDTPGYTVDPYYVNGPIYSPQGAVAVNRGLPFAYDPLWRWQTDHVNGGIYLQDTHNPSYATTPGMTPEARFAAGNVLRTVIPSDYDGNGEPSAHGLQRLTNFNRPAYTNAAGNLVMPVMPSASTVPGIFVSPEDMVVQDPTVIPQASPVVPDFSISGNDSLGSPQVTFDWRFSWMITGRQTNTANGAAFDGNVVIFENRAFGLDLVPAGNTGTSVYQASGEMVYEGIFGYSQNVVTAPGYAVGYASGADRVVLVRWPAGMEDPVIKVGNWIADVTYERVQSVANLRCSNFPDPVSGVLGGVPNMLNNGEWDNLPAQRCIWYQVQKLGPVQNDPLGGYRAMVVYVDRKLEARTLLQPGGAPVYRNAVLVAPHVVNVIPQSFFLR